MLETSVRSRTAAVAGIVGLLGTPFSIGLPGGAAPLFAAPDGFSAIELPPVETRMGDFRDVQPTGIDNRGRVVGGASLWEEESPFSFDYWTGFRFDSDTGVSSVVDPFDTLVTDVYLVNRRGTSFGETFRPAYWRGKLRTELFLYNPDSGFDLLRKGSKRWIRNGFIFHDLTDGGNLAGVARPRAGKRLAALLYLGDRGWIDLAKQYGRLPGWVEEIRVNDAGEFALEIYPNVLIPGQRKSLERFGPEGFEFFLEELGANGEVIGYYTRPALHKYDSGGPPRPYVHTPKQGFVDILPSGFESGWARWISKAGVVRGTAIRDRSGDTVFSWDAAGGFESVNLKEAFEDTGSELTFRHATVIDVNDRGDFIAEIKTRRPWSTPRCTVTRKGVLFVYFDSGQGLVDLQQVIDENGLDLEIFDVVDLNDRGEVVARACRGQDQPRTGVLFVPR
ncbi:MAG: hypothetical protein GY769_19020 [bacterium]|nr:hypothetical protein [bacterium]